MKINVAGLSRKPRTYFETDLVTSYGRTYPFRFVKNDALTAFKTRDLDRELREKYLEEEFPFPPFGVGSEEIQVSGAMIEAVCPLVVLQAPANGDAYTFEELVWLSATEEKLWLDLQNFFWKSQYGAPEAEEKTAEECLGEPSGAPTLPV